jgi:hypothetical protein
VRRAFLFKLRFRVKFRLKLRVAIHGWGWEEEEMRDAPRDGSAVCSINHESCCDVNRVSTGLQI